MKNLFKIIMIVILALALFGSAAMAANDKIKIGCIQDLSGATQSLGNSVMEGVRTAVNEINAAGGINGQTIELLEYDTAADVTAAVNAYMTAVDVDECDLLIGPPIANIVNGLKSFTDDGGVPFITFAVDPACYTDQDGNLYKYLSCVQPSTTVQGSIMAKFALENGYKNFGVFYTEDNSYSVALVTPFVETIRENGGTLEDANIIPYNSQETDIKTLIEPLVKANVDAIYCPNYTQPLIKVETAITELGYEGYLINGLDAAPNFNDLIEGVEDLSHVYYINNIDIYDPTVAEMASKVSVGAINKYFLGYDAIMLAKKCIEEVGLDSDALAEAIVNVQGFEGLTGTFNMDPNTHMPAEDTPMFMYTYDVKTPVMLKEFSFK
jgi:branched-chain amino acid transport system substrate-binding protein